MRKNIKEFLGIILGTAFMALGIVFFLLPNQLSSGGFSGITTVLYYLFNFKIGTTTFIMNVPLFFIAFFKLGKKFFTKAIFGTVIFSALLNAFESAFVDVPMFTDDKLLASIYGGLMVGLGTAIILKCNASTGRYRTSKQYNF